MAEDKPVQLKMPICPYCGKELYQLVFPNFYWQKVLWTCTCDKKVYNLSPDKREAHNKVPI